MRCESISWSPTLADNREVLEHVYAAEQHFVHSIWGMHKADPEWGMLKERPSLDITRSIRYEVWAQVDKVESNFIHSAKYYVEELYDLHRFKSDAECLAFIDSRRADNMYRFPVAECVEGGVRGQNPTQRLSQAAKEYPASTLLHGGRNPGVCLHHNSSSGECLR